MKKTKPRRKVLPREVFFEAKLMNMTSQAYADKINANIDLEAETATLNKKDKSIIRDAKTAGLDTGTEEKRQKILSEWKERENKIPKSADTLTEKAKVLAEQTGTKLEIVEQLLREEEEKKERAAEFGRISQQNIIAGAKRKSLRGSDK